MPVHHVKMQHFRFALNFFFNLFAYFGKKSADRSDGEILIIAFISFKALYSAV